MTTRKSRGSKYIDYDWIIPVSIIFVAILAIFIAYFLYGKNDID